MTNFSLATVAPVALPELNVAPDLQSPRNSAVSGFSAVTDQLDKMAQTLSANEAATADFARGSSAIPTHELMIRMESARLDLALTLQVRNKLLEAVQEIYRTQI